MAKTSSAMRRSSAMSAGGNATVAEKSSPIVVDGEIATMTQKQLDDLIDMGAKRWTKGDKDRLYLRGALDAILGIETTSYKSGSISSATMNGEKISNNEANKIYRALGDAYINLNTGGIGGVLEGARKDMLVDAIDRKYRKKK